MTRSSDINEHADNGGSISHGPPPPIPPKSREIYEERFMTPGHDNQFICTVNDVIANEEDILKQGKGDIYSDVDIHYDIIWKAD